MLINKFYKDENDYHDFDSFKKGLNCLLKREENNAINEKNDAKTGWDRFEAEVSLDAIQYGEMILQNSKSFKELEDVINKTFADLNDEKNRSSSASDVLSHRYTAEIMRFIRNQERDGYTKVAVFALKQQQRKEAKQK